MRCAAILALLFSIAGPCVPARADEHFRPSRPEQLTDATKDTGVRVVGARVAYANFTALRRDFPQLASLNEEEISHWILDNFAFINEQELRLSGIRASEMPVNRAETKPDYRPENYGRAGVLEAQYHGQAIGLVDIKGNGHPDADKEKVDEQVAEFQSANGDPAKIDALRTKDHSDGLMTFGEAIAELTKQTGVQRAFDVYNARNHSDYQTVESYFVIELPFDIIKKDGARDRAALYGRQAHWRRDFSGISHPPDIYTDDFGGFQGTKTGAAVDFGGVIVTEPSLAPNYAVRPGGKSNNPQDSLAWSWGHEVARAYGRGDLGAIYRHLAEMVAPINAEWEKVPRGVYLPEVEKQLTLLRLADSPHPSPALIKEFADALQQGNAWFSKALAGRLTPDNALAALEQVSPTFFQSLTKANPWWLDYHFLPLSRQLKSSSAELRRTAAMKAQPGVLLSLAANPTAEALAEAHEVAETLASTVDTGGYEEREARLEALKKYKEIFGLLPATMSGTPLPPPEQLEKKFGEDLLQEIAQVHTEALGVVIDDLRNLLNRGAPDRILGPALMEKCLALVRDKEQGLNDRYTYLDYYSKIRDQLEKEGLSVTIPAREALDGEIVDEQLGLMGAIGPMEREKVLRALIHVGAKDSRLAPLQAENIRALIQNPQGSLKDRWSWLTKYRDLADSVKVPSAEELQTEILDEFFAKPLVSLSDAGFLAENGALEDPRLIPSVARALSEAVPPVSVAFFEHNKDIQSALREYYFGVLESSTADEAQLAEAFARYAELYKQLPKREKFPSPAEIGERLVAKLSDDRNVDPDVRLHLLNAIDKSVGQKIPLSEEGLLSLFSASLDKHRRQPSADPAEETRNTEVRMTALRTHLDDSLPVSRELSRRRLDFLLREYKYDGEGARFRVLSYLNASPVSLSQLKNAIARAYVGANQEGVASVVASAWKSPGGAISRHVARGLRAASRRVDLSSDALALIANTALDLKIALPDLARTLEAKLLSAGDLRTPENRVLLEALTRQPNYQPSQAFQARMKRADGQGILKPLLGKLEQSLARDLTAPVSRCGGSLSALGTP